MRRASGHPLGPTASGLHGSGHQGTRWTHRPPRPTASIGGSLPLLLDGIRDDGACSPTEWFARAVEVTKTEASSVSHARR